MCIYVQYHLVLCMYVDCVTCILYCIAKRSLARTTLQMSQFMTISIELLLVATACPQHAESATQTCDVHQILPPGLARETKNKKW